MVLTADQVKGRIKNLAKQNGADARVLIRIYMMRDYYDIYMLHTRYAKQINAVILKRAFHATCEKRESLQLEEQGSEIIQVIAGDAALQALWLTYQKKYSYAADISYEEAISSITELYKAIS